jgi:glyoxylase-like metal-dependent hydrolase (beta-lactamase superfamily II)
MVRRVAVRILAVTVVILGSGFAAQQVVRYPGSEHEGAAFDIKQVVPGVYHALGTGAMNVGANVVIVVGDRDVLLVDANASPAAAATLLEELRAITDKPVRTVVNTHYHFDHAHGNQAFSPGVEILGHEYTRERLSGDVLNEATYRSFTSTLPERIAEMRRGLTPELGSEQRRELEARVAVQEAHLAALSEVDPTPPTVTLRDKLTIHRGERAIELLHLGRGHTGGDVVVFLPRERIVFTGDLLLPFPSYMGDGFIDEWPETLERLKLLDFDWILPGHGGATNDRRIIDHFQGVLRSLWTQTEQHWHAGRSVDEAVARIDLSEAMAAYGSSRPTNTDPRAVARIFALLNAR